MRRIVSAIAVLFCVAGTAGRSLAAEADHTEKASKEAFELLTAPTSAPADMTIKIVGDQHHWTYAYTSPPGPEFKSSATAETAGQPEMDSDIVVPQGKSVEFLVTSNDQVYELAIQGLGTSLTAVPGRLQSLTLMTKKVGRLVAVCSSDCDANGRADAIVIRVASPVDYERWLRRKMDKRP